MPFETLKDQFEDELEGDMRARWLLIFSLMSSFCLVYSLKTRNSMSGAV